MAKFTTKSGKLSSHNSGTHEVSSGRNLFQSRAIFPWPSFLTGFRSEAAQTALEPQTAGKGKRQG